MKFRARPHVMGRLEVVRLRASVPVSLLALALASMSSGCATRDPEQGMQLSTTAPGESTPILVAPPAEPVPLDVSDAAAPVGNDAALPSQARCGATPYQWLPPATMGDLLDSKSASPHTPIELNLAALKLKNDGAFKSRRFSKHSTKAELVRYRTQDRGKSVAATALVTRPASSGPTTFPILLFLHGTAGFNDACSPSRAIAESSNGGFADPVGILAALMASYGYVTVFPDYIGLNSFGPPSNTLHPYLVGEPTAIASLDAVRAAHKWLAATDVTPGPLLVVGASQGGHAAAFVDRFAPHYAPELPITAEAWVIPPTDLAGHMKVALGGPSATKAWANIAGFLLGAESWYAASPNGFSGAFQAPFDKILYDVWSTQCESSPAVSEATPATVFTSAILAASQMSPVGQVDPFTCYMRESSVGTTSVPRASDVPALFVLGEKDKLVDPTVERASFQSLCAAGYRLSYRECAGQDHTESFFRSWDDWFDFLEARIAGEPLTGACTISGPQVCSSVP